MTKWEHKVLEVAASDTAFTETRLNGFGSAGWELVGVAACVTTQFIYLRRKRMPHPRNTAEQLKDEK